MIDNQTSSYLDIITTDSFGGYSNLLSFLTIEEITYLTTFSGFIEIIKPWDYKVNLQEYGLKKPTSVYKVYDSNFKYLYSTQAFEGHFGSNQEDIDFLFSTKHGSYGHIIFEGSTEPVIGLLWVAKELTATQKRATVDYRLSQIKWLEEIDRSAEVIINPYGISAAENDILTIYSLSGRWELDLTVEDIINNVDAEVVQQPATEQVFLYPKLNNWYVFSWSIFETGETKFLKLVDIQGIGNERIVYRDGLHFISPYNTLLRSSVSIGYNFLANRSTDNNYYGKGNRLEIWANFEEAFSTSLAAIQLDVRPRVIGYLYTGIALIEGSAHTSSISTHGDIPIFSSLIEGSAHTSLISTHGDIPIYSSLIDTQGFVSVGLTTNVLEGERVNAGTLEVISCVYGDAKNVGTTGFSSEFISLNVLGKISVSIKTSLKAYLDPNVYKQVSLAIRPVVLINLTWGVRQLNTTRYNLPKQEIRPAAHTTFDYQDGTDLVFKLSACRVRLKTSCNLTTGVDLATATEAIALTSSGLIHLTHGINEPTYLDEDEVYAISPIVIVGIINEVINPVEESLATLGSVIITIVTST